MITRGLVVQITFWDIVKEQDDGQELVEEFWTHTQRGQGGQLTWRGARSLPLDLITWVPDGAEDPSKLEQERMDARQ